MDFSVLGGCSAGLVVGGGRREFVEIALGR